ncbi:hypothetical protein HAX54_030470, partial [Datura stramonium]|nr:hypothetical protein [Datura stramonium]
TAIAVAKLSDVSCAKSYRGAAPMATSFNPPNVHFGSDKDSNSSPDLTVTTQVYTLDVTR